MKRISENVAVQTVLYIVHPTAKVKIIDYDDTIYKVNPQIMYYGLKKDISLFNKEYPLCDTHKVQRAAVKNISVAADGAIELSICTKNEQY